MAFYKYPSTSGGGTSSNASVGTNGAATPTSSTLVAGKDPGGLTKPLNVDVNGDLNLNVVTSALPSGASTAANQTTGNTSLSSIDGKTPALGQALAASSVPVVLPSAQVTALTPPTSVTVSPVAALNATGTVTAAGVLFSQDCSQFQSASIHLTSLPAGNVVTFQVSNDNVNWYSCATMPGGDLVSILATTASTAGSYTTQLNSRYFRVNCTTFVSGTITANAYFKNFGNSPNSVGGYLSAVTLDGSGNAITSTSGALDVNIKSDAATIPVTVAGVATAANQATEISSLSTIATNSSATQGTVAAGAAASKADLVAGVFNSTLPALTTGQQAAVQLDSNARLIIGSIAASTSIAQGTRNSLSIQTVGRSSVAPFRQNYTVTSVTTAAYTQVIASTSAAINEVEIFDSSGQTLAFSVGAAGSEVIQLYIFPGGNGRVPLYIPIGSRVAIQAVSANATAGEIDINFYQ